MLAAADHDWRWVGAKKRENRDDLEVGVLAHIL